MTRIERFTIGRNDFSLTVYVPWDCNNKCKFCSSKSDYSLINCDFDKVLEQLKRIRNSKISTVVFTGGEPLNNLELSLIVLSASSTICVVLSNGVLGSLKPI